MFKDFMICFYKISEIFKFKAYNFKRAFMYLILLTLIFGSIQGYSKIRIMNAQFNEVTHTMSSWNFRIQDGRFLIEDLPKEINIDSFIIYFPKDDQTPIFDRNNIYMVINDKSIGIYFNGSKTDFPALSFETLSKDEFLSSLRTVNTILSVFTFIFTLIAFFLGKIIAAYFIAALLINSITARILSYKFSDLFKLSFYIMTLAITVQSILFAFGFEMLLSIPASTVLVFVSFLMLRMVLQYEFKTTHK